MRDTAAPPGFLSLEGNVGLQGFLRSERFLQLSLAKPLESYAVDFLFHVILSFFFHSKKLGSGKVWVPISSLCIRISSLFDIFVGLIFACSLSLFFIFASHTCF